MKNKLFNINHVINNILAKSILKNTFIVRITKSCFHTKRKAMFIITVNTLLFFMLVISCDRIPGTTGQVSIESKTSNTSALYSESSSYSFSGSSTASSFISSDISSKFNSSTVSSNNVSGNTDSTNSISASNSNTNVDPTPTPDISQYKEPYLYVKDNSLRYLNFRTQPNTQGTIIRQLKPGMKLKFLASYDMWFKVLSPYEEVGFVYGGYVTDITPIKPLALQESDLFTKWEDVALTKGYYTAGISKYIGRTLGQGYEPLKGITVILDPGHGGTDFGAEHKLSGLTTIIKEKSVNLSVSLNLEKELIKLGATVFMTRNDDSSTGLYYRSAFINKIVLEKHNALLEKKIKVLLDLEQTRSLTDSEKSDKSNLTVELTDCVRLITLMQNVMNTNSDYQLSSGQIGFKVTGLFEGLGSNSDLRKIMDISREYEDIVVVSIHCNNILNAPTKNGIEIYYGTNSAIYKYELSLLLLDPKRNILNPSYQFYNDTYRMLFAQSIRDRILTETNLQLATIDSLQSNDGLRESSTCITRENNLTGIQIELGYLSNNDDRTFLTEPTGQKRVAHGIALGIYDYFCKNIS